jgi:hypothetical protein
MSSSAAPTLVRNRSEKEIFPNSDSKYTFNLTASAALGADQACVPRQRICYHLTLQIVFKYSIPFQLQSFPYVMTSHTLRSLISSFSFAWKSGLAGSKAPSSGAAAPLALAMVEVVMRTQYLRKSSINHARALNELYSMNYIQKITTCSQG